MIWLYLPTCAQVYVLIGNGYRNTRGRITKQLSHKCLYGIKMNCSVGYYRDPDKVLFQNVNKTYKNNDEYGNFFGYIICRIMYVNI